MRFSLSLIERFENPSAEIKLGFWRFGGEPPGTTRPVSFILDNGCSPPHGDTNSAPLDVWLKAVGPVHQRGPANHPDSFTHAPGWSIWEDQDGLPDASILRPVLYRLLHTRIQREGKTQAVAAQMFIPSFGEKAPEPQGMVTKSNAPYPLCVIERIEPTPEIKTGWFFFSGLSFVHAPG